MEYIVIILLIVILIVCVISLSKNINEGNITERLGRLETSLTKEVGDFKTDFGRTLTEDFNRLNERIEFKLNAINERVNIRLDENFEKTNKTFTSVLERLSKIDEAQKKIDSLSSDIVSLQGVLTDKKSRGIFGEVNLKHILSNIFGEKNDRIYQMQYSFQNSTIVDAVLFAPEPLGTIAIDSKFPLEHYQLMVDKNLSSVEREKNEKEFKNDVKKHIDAISSKYIIPNVTSDQAIMFLPAEAIFAEINAYHQDVIDYANKKRVWITSPTTLMSTLTVVQMVIRNMERDKYASIIQEELSKLSVEFSLYRRRWDKLSQHIQTVSKDVEEVHITTRKISKRFDSINKVDVDKLQVTEEIETINNGGDEDESDLQ
ncbi:MAG: DNA recombination protein RmuC [Bacilli bacterium]|nr:DNA recombination protein RmuC [Bacilli bacterium]MDD3304547.1 DNA recombination protein RmuC [Bacilli bacterium]MDD4053837.1 DNA recombination protein RmuC [Bacilli bacterium]MDD4411296.1 DNA recombination protein RmuC [Bacilli bacterium]